jgi:hypothetical protein
MKNIIALILIGLLGCGVAFARDKTDVLILDNGDRITGEIKNLQHGRLQISTDRMGVIDVEWEGVVTVKSNYEFQFDRANGQRLSGRIAKGSEAGYLVVEGDGESVSIPRDLIIRISQLEESFRDALSGSMTFGYSFTKASDVAQLNLGFRVRHRNLTRSFALEGSTIITDDQATETTQRSDLRLSRTRFRSNRWFNAYLIGFESNDELGLNLRSSFNASIGRFLRQSNTSELAVFGGLVASNESLANDVSSQDNLEGLLGLEYSRYSFSEPNVDMSFKMAVYPSFTDSGRVRGQLDAGIRRELISDLFWDLTFYETYDNKPPSGSESTTDYGVVTSVGWSF